MLKVDYESRWLGFTVIRKQLDIFKINALLSIYLMRDTVLLGATSGEDITGR